MLFSCYLRDGIVYVPTIALDASRDLSIRILSPSQLYR